MAVPALGTRSGEAAISMLVRCCMPSIVAEIGSTAARCSLAEENAAAVDYPRLGHRRPVDDNSGRCSITS
jgi:hypothetical protein